MHPELHDPTQVSVSGWLVLTARKPPAILSSHRSHASLVESFGDERSERGYWFAGVSRPGEDLPSLVVTQGYAPSEGGFPPGLLVVPEADGVFLGAGDRLLHYSWRDGWRRDWEDRLYFGFWRWRQHGDIVLMSGETELTAWTAAGTKCWSTDVEPPWDYTVRGDDVRLEVMGRLREFPLLEGPRRG